MFCTSCGMSLRDEDRFCAKCGKATGTEGFAPPAGAQRRLRRSITENKIAGVCGGFAEYFGVDVTLMRILWLVGTFYTVGTGILVYLLCWFVLPVEQPRVSFAREPYSTGAMPV